MQKIRIAFATDNGKTFMGRHFGDADFYDIYEIEGKKTVFTKRISNTMTKMKKFTLIPKKQKVSVSYCLTKI